MSSIPNEQDGAVTPALPEAREQRIRERAYFFWVAEGRPEGRAAEHWRRAEAAEEPYSDRQVDEAVNETFPASDPPALTPMTGIRRSAG